MMNANVPQMMNSSIPPIVIGLGEGRVGISLYETSGNRHGLLFEDTGEPHEIGARTVIDESDAIHERSPGEVYIECSNRESAIVLRESVDDLIDLFVSSEPTIGQLRKLWSVVRGQVEKLCIECQETIYQTDRVAEGAYEFIAQCCEVVGYCDGDRSDGCDE